GLLAGAGERIAEPAADRMAERHMRDEPAAEKALAPRKGAIDELINQHEGAGRQLRLEAAHRGQRDEVGDAGPLQRIDIGAVVDLRRRDAMAAAMARQEDDARTGERAEAQFV